MQKISRYKQTFQRVAEDPQKEKLQVKLKPRYKHVSVSWDEMI